MAPKAKAGGRPKAMAAMRRPAVAGGGGAVIAPRRRGLRRPAALGEGQTPWELGQEVDLHTVPLDKLAPGLSLAVTKAEYFGGTVKIAGTIVRVEQTRNDVSLWMELSGTDSEAILKAHSGKRGQEFRLHLCSPMCDRQESGDYLLHALKGRRVRLEGEEGWVTSLELGKDDPAEDELAAVRLRERQLALDKREDAKKPKKSRKRSRSEEVSVEAKDKTKKKKKKKEKSETLHNGRHASRAVQKSLDQLFAGTALDPREKIRRRVLHKASRFAAKKKNKRSSSSASSGSSSSSTSSTSPAVGDEGVFTEETKAKLLSEKFPGALAMETLLSMRKSLLATAGEQGDALCVRPVALLYFRNILGRKTTGAQSRELLNISTAIDSLLQGKPALTLDIAAEGSGSRHRRNGLAGSAENRVGSKRLGCADGQGRASVSSTGELLRLPSPLARQRERREQVEDAPTPRYNSGEDGPTAARHARKAAREQDFRERTFGSHASSASSGLGNGPTAGGMFFPIGAPLGDPVPLVDLGHRVPCQSHSALVTPGSDESGVEKGWSELEGSSILEMGLKVQQWLLGVIPLRGQTTGRRGKNTLFPLPTSSSKLLACFPSLCPLELVWLVCVVCWVELPLGRRCLVRW